MKKRNTTKINRNKILEFITTASDAATCGVVSDFTCPICGRIAQATKANNGHCMAACQGCGMNFTE